MNEHTTGNDQGIVEDLADDIDCARLAAESALDTKFAEHAIVGYGQRSKVFFAKQAVLKVYTHRWEERASREAAGLRAAAHAVDLRVPELLAHDGLPGSLSWLACTRLTGTQPSPHDANTTTILGQVAARLHTLPAHHVDKLAEHRRRLHELPRGTTSAHQAAHQLDDALAQAAPTSDRDCVRGFVHGDCSSRNVLLNGDEQPGVIDFEGSGAGCVTEDLAALMLHESLVGTRDRRVLLNSYDAERQRLDLAVTPVRPHHLAYHLVIRARWIMQWAIDLDPEMADAITELTPWLLDTLI